MCGIMDSMKWGETMPIVYKLDMLDALKKAGYTTYRLRKEKLLAESTLQSFRAERPISWENLTTLCRLLDCQPGDLMEYIPDSDPAPEPPSTI